MKKYVIVDTARMENELVNNSPSSSYKHVRTSKDFKKAIFKFSGEAPEVFRLLPQYSQSEILTILEDPEWEQINSSFAIQYTQADKDAYDAKADALKDEITPPHETDQSKRPLVSTVIVPKGWSYHAPNFRFQTGVASSVDFKDKFGGDMSSMVTLQFYDSAAGYATFSQCAPGDALYTVATFTPPYDYYVVSGSMRQKNTPAEQVSLYATLAPFVPYAQGGAREFICCADLQYRLDGMVEADGKAPKFVPYLQVNETPPLYSNSIEIFLRTTSAGFQHEVEISIGLYRE